MIADVIVVGGGIIGLSCAQRLAKDGLKVTLLEGGRCGQEASWAGAGIISPCSWHRRDALARMHMDAVFSYHRFAADLQERTGIDPQFQRCGALRLILDDNRMKMARNEVRAIGDRRTPEGQPIAQTLSPAEAKSLEPHLDGEILGAQHCRMTAQVRNPRLLEALVAGCAAAGAEIHEGAPVRALLKEGQRVMGVKTDQGEFKAGMTVLCAGAWSSQLDPLLAERMPIHPVRGQIMLLLMDHPPLRRIIEREDDFFYLVPRVDGHVLVGSTQEHDAGYSKRNTASGLARLSRLALEHVPLLSEATLVRTWAGLRPGTPDRRPFMGFVPDFENLLAATGHFRTGLTVAPVVAEIVCELIQTGTCSYDLAKAAPGRDYPT